MKTGETSRQLDQNNIKTTPSGNETHSSKLIIIGIISLFLLHFIVGFIQTPDKIIEAGLQRGIVKIYIKTGYAIGVFGIFALPIPLGFSLLSLLIKSKRSLASFTKILFICLVVTLSLNILTGFVFAPRAVQNINLNSI